MEEIPNPGSQVIDPQFFELFCGAIDTALQYVRHAKTGKTHIGYHDNWPELQYHEENGLPWVSTSAQGPKDYGEALNGLYSALFALPGDPGLDFTKEPSFVALLQYAKTQPRLRQYFLFEYDLGTAHLMGTVAYALDRYAHQTGTKDLDRAKLLPIYGPLEKYLFNSVLAIVVVVPILFLKFDFSQLQLGASVSVEPLSDEFHLARGWRGRFGDADNSLVESAATHGLFIRGVSFENENWLKQGEIKMDPGSYPLEKIDAFFASLRIATGHPTGYAQIVAVPVDWASSYAADLTPVSGPRMEKYPPVFERGYWREQVPTVTASQAAEAEGIFNGLQKVFETGDAQKVRVAMHRLNLSATRTSDEDGIIDSVIAMEALLSDGAQEMTYKVAMRLGALYKILAPSRAVEAVTEMKRIYRFRSKVVHGSADLDTDREINRAEGKVATIDAAFEHLRNAFATLIKNPALLDPKRIDKFLLTDAF